MNRTPEQKKMLRTAARLRKLVVADLQKTANPALMALIRGIGPMLSRMGPQVMKQLPKMMEAIPPETLAQLLQSFIGSMSQAAQAGAKSASKSPDFVEVRNKIQASLTKAGFKGAEALATRLVAAVAGSVVAARKGTKLNKDLRLAYKLGQKNAAEISLLAELA